jgi:hypothetical protein
MKRGMVMIKTWTKRMALGVVASLMLAPNVVSAQGVFGPKLVPYSGHVEQNGLKADGTRNLRFSLYTAQEAGDAIWTEIHDDVPMSQGRFSVKLGANAAIEAHVWVREELYLEIAVCPGAACAAAPAGDEVKMSRQRMLAVPYARHAANGNPTGSVTAYLGNTAPPGWLMCDGSAIPNDPRHAALIAIVGNNTPNLQGQFLRGATGARAVRSSESWQTARPRNAFTTGSNSRSHTHSGTTGNNSRSHAHSRTLQNSTFSGDCGCANGSAHMDRGGGGSGRNSGNNNATHNHAFNTGDNNVVHTHNITTGGDSETRPDNYGVNYIIKI